MTFAPIWSHSGPSQPSSRVKTSEYAPRPGVVIAGGLAPIAVAQPRAISRCPFDCGCTGGVATYDANSGYVVKIALKSGPVWQPVAAMAFSQYGDQELLKAGFAR